MWPIWGLFPSTTFNSYRFRDTFDESRFTHFPRMRQSVRENFTKSRRNSDGLVKNTQQSRFLWYFPWMKLVLWIAQLSPFHWSFREQFTKLWPKRWWFWEELTSNPRFSLYLCELRFKCSQQFPWSWCEKSTEMSSSLWYVCEFRFTVITVPLIILWRVSNCVIHVSNVFLKRSRKSHRSRAIRDESRSTKGLQKPLTNAMAIRYRVKTSVILSVTVFLKNTQTSQRFRVIPD